MTQYKTFALAGVALLGLCLGSAELNAAKPKSRPKSPALSSEQHLAKGRQAFESYLFETAREQAGLARRRASESELEDIDELTDQIDLAENFLERVEKIVILDSLSVAKQNFFQAYRLPASAGTLSVKNEDIDNENIPEDADLVFTNEDETYQIWSQPDSTGYYTLLDSNRLTDGTWTPAHALPAELAGGGNMAFPFMMPDGVTLYYAADGEGSMGGYDIFVATRDASTGEYLQPQNIGMPYNSPFDDYLLAIDEENGVGWWATERANDPDNVTIYLFKTNDLRQNYDRDDDNVESFARIERYKDSWQDGEDYSQLLDEVKNITPRKKHRVDFIFPMGRGAVYTTLDDFKTAAGKAAMGRYLSAEKIFNDDIATLADLRRTYSRRPTDSLRSRIAKLEKETETERAELTRLRSEVYRAEKK